MFEIMAPWGQWKRGDLKLIARWLKLWSSIADQTGKKGAFVIRRVDDD